MRATVEACLILGVTVLQVLFGAALMFGIAPYLLLLPLAAAVPVFTGARAERAIQDARGRAVTSQRQLRHVRSLATTAASQKELRLGDSADYLLAANSMFAIPGQGPLPALQVLYPDAAGLWPWQEGSTVADEPVLGPVPTAETGNTDTGEQ
jgi:hypothetical protein